MTGLPAIAHPAPAKAQGVSLPAAVVHHSVRAARPRVPASAHPDPSRRDPTAAPGRRRTQLLPAQSPFRPRSPFRSWSLRLARIAPLVQIALSASPQEIVPPAARAALTTVLLAAMGHPAHRATAPSRGRILPRRSPPGTPLRAGQCFARVESVQSARSRPARVHQDRRVRSARHRPVPPQRPAPRPSRWIQQARRPARLFQ